MSRGRTARTQIHRGSGRAGFMLVEVLATMTISALLLAALFSVTSLTLRVSGRVERQTQQIEERTRLLAALAREIERAVPARWAGRDGAFIFTGNAGSLAFAAEIPVSNAATEMRAVFIDGANVITRRVAALPPTALSFDQISISRPEIMSDGGYKLAFAYFARLPDGREALLETWADPNQFPVAVRLTLSGADGNMSSVRVTFDVGAEPGCGFPESGRCSLRPIDNKQETALTATVGAGG